MKTAIISANLGNFEKSVEHVRQSIPVDFYRFTDENFPPRHRAMTPRLQARIPKLFGWQMIPSYDYYIWVDGSFTLSSPDSAKWLIGHCQGVDAAFLKHPLRETIQQETDFIKGRINKFITKQSSRHYLYDRYHNELFDEEMAEINADKGFDDKLLIASGYFIYKNNDRVRNLMKEWWYHISRYNIMDQIGLSYAIYKSKCRVKIIDEDYLNTQYLKITR